MDFSSKESSIPLTLSLLLLSRLIFGGDGIHVIRYRHRLNILALSGKVFLDRYKTNLTAKPVSLRPDQANFFSVNERGRHNEEETVQWHTGCAETLALAAPPPLCTSVAGSAYYQFRRSSRQQQATA